jgi:membrane protease YdiL (CAAX protease family)
VFGFLFSPLGEEIGWRGFALPRLTKHMSALSAALLTGVIWIVWHAPVFLVPPLERAIFPPGLSYLAFACMALPVSVLISWVYLNGRSLLLPVFFHFLVLFQVTSIQKDAPLALVWASISLFAAAAALVVVSYGPELVRQTKPHG